MREKMAYSTGDVAPAALELQLTIMLLKNGS
jgi:hypothetical protein